MTETDKFPEFPKIHRLRRELVVTEKIDGTNALVSISEDGSIRAGSRSRWITPQDDNFGFARWVEEHKDELSLLGPGNHYGEWWGAGIQRRYGLTEKRFSLFNVGRWGDLSPGRTPPPPCCSLVPVLVVTHDFNEAWRFGMTVLRDRGSIAAPGFMKPEGIVVFHSASRVMFKVTFEGDEKGKTG